MLSLKVDEITLFRNKLCWSFIWSNYKHTRSNNVQKFCWKKNSQYEHFLSLIVFSVISTCESKLFENMHDCAIETLDLTMIS